MENDIRVGRHDHIVKGILGYNFWLRDARACLVVAPEFVAKQSFRCHRLWFAGIGADRHCYWHRYAPLYLVQNAPNRGASIHRSR